jgi:hypothetical protein
MDLTYEPPLGSEVNSHGCQLHQYKACSNRLVFVETRTSCLQESLSFRPLHYYYFYLKCTLKRLFDYRPRLTFVVLGDFKRSRCRSHVGTVQGKQPGSAMPCWCAHPDTVKAVPVLRLNPDEVFLGVGAFLD